MNDEIRKKLEEKFGKNTARTGGKGSRRRKTLNKKSKIQSTHLSNEEKEYSNIIQKINNLIEHITNDDNIELWNFYVTEYFGDYLFDSKKKNFKDIKYSNIEDEDDPLFDEFIENILDEEDDKIIIKYNYVFLKSILTNNGYEIFYYYLEDLPKILEKEEYIPEDCDNDDEDINVNEYLTLLGLPLHEIPTKELLRKSYFKLSTKVHPDKHPKEQEKYNKLFAELNKAYHSLIEYYYPKNN